MVIYCMSSLASLQSLPPCGKRAAAPLSPVGYWLSSRVQRSFCRAEIRSRALTSERVNRGKEGAAECARQNSRATHVFTPTPFYLRAAHVAELNIKGSVDRRLCFFMLSFPASLSLSLLVPNFKPS